MEDSVTTRGFKVQTDAKRRVALITGASAGLGREFCEQFAADGYDIIAVARDESRLQALARDLEARHAVKVEVLRADLSDDAETSRVVERISAAEPPDVIVNNAGFGTTGTFARTSPATQEAMLRVHALAPMRLTQAALPAMLRRGSGGIINVASVASMLSSPGNVNYCATKAYLRVFSQGVAQEIAGTGVVIQALCPGFTHTEFHQRMNTDKGKIPAWAWMSAETVVRDSIAALRRGNPVVVVPGFGYKLIVAVLRHVPLRLAAKIARRYRRDT